MAILDLTLDSFEVPALSEYTPPFGHKKQKDGLSTLEVNNNVMLPFVNMRPTVVSENSVTTRIDYDAKLVFFAGLQEAVNLDLEEASYKGCEILIYNLSVHDCTVSKGTWSCIVPAREYIKVKWNGSAWSEDVSSVVYTAIRNAIGDCQSYSTTESQTGGTWIDGKPIYRKVFVSESDSIGFNTHLEVPYIGNIVNQGVLYRRIPSDSCTPIIYRHGTGETAYITLKWSTAGEFGDGYSWWIEYTKTTD